MRAELMVFQSGIGEGSINRLIPRSDFRGGNIRVFF